VRCPTARFVNDNRAILETDYAQPADEDQVWSIWHGNAS